MLCVIPIADFLYYDNALLKKNGQCTDWQDRRVCRQFLKIVLSKMFVHVWGCIGHVESCRVGFYTALCCVVFWKIFLHRCISTIYNDFVCWFLSALIKDFVPVNVGTGKCTIMLRGVKFLNQLHYVNYFFNIIKILVCCKWRLNIDFNPFLKINAPQISAKRHRLYMRYLFLTMKSLVQATRYPEKFAEVYNILIIFW